MYGEAEVSQPDKGLEAFEYGGSEVIWKLDIEAEEATMRVGEEHKGEDPSICLIVQQEANSDSESEKAPRDFKITGFFRVSKGIFIR